MSNFVTADMRDMDRLQRNLRAEIGVSSRSKDEILNRLGNDLRINLFKGFWKQKWTKGRKGGGFRLLRQLSKSGKGVHVRLLRLTGKWTDQIPENTKGGKDLTMWQKLVAQEIVRRQAGVGVLGVSFLRKRWRYKKDGRYLTKNTTRGLGTAVTFEKTDDAFIIRGFTPGLAKVAQRYGVLGTAMRVVAGKTEAYLRRKLGPEFVRQLHAR